MENQGHIKGRYNLHILIYVLKVFVHRQVDTSNKKKSVENGWYFAFFK